MFQLARGVVALTCACVALVGWACAGTPVEIREKSQVGACERVVIELKAKGLFREGPPPGADAAGASKKVESAQPLSLQVETRLDFAERVTQVDDVGRPLRTARRVYQAASAINGEIRPSSASLRPEVAILSATRREGAAIVFSPGGPLTRSELELVQGPGDPLTLAGLLPARAVASGARWTVEDATARGLSGYDVLTSNGLEAELEEETPARFKFKVAGTVKGSALGGEGSITFRGSFTFDRAAARIDQMTLDRDENRSQGPIEAGLEVKSTLTVTRRTVEVPAELADAALKGLPLVPEPARLLLLLDPPGGKYTLLHDRDWHVFWDNTRQTVLRRLEKGLVVAQCNLSLGPNAGKGCHQDLKQFREEVRAALGARFREFLGEGGVEGDPAEGFRHKVGVRGREGDLDVIWYYYLAASPEGEQLVAAFTLSASKMETFGAQDEQLLASLKWSMVDQKEKASP